MGISLKVPDITDFSNFAIGAACVDSYNKHTSLTMKLRSIQLGGEVILERILPLIYLQLSASLSPKEQLDLSKLNIDLGIVKLSSPKLGELPECMGSILLGEDMKAETLESISLKTKIFLESALKTYQGDINSLVKSANNIISKSLSEILEPKDLELFEMLDTLQYYIKDTEYIENYKKWVSITSCIETNCPSLKKTIMQDDFMWSDDAKKEFIMPVDINTGKLHIHKFLNYPSKTLIKDCNILELRYYSYVNLKKQLASEASDKVKANNISDDKNPFIGMF